jgi:hypothetical protein
MISLKHRAANGKIAVNAAVRLAASAGLIVLAVVSAVCGAVSLAPKRITEESPLYTYEYRLDIDSYIKYKANAFFNDGKHKDGHGIIASLVKEVILDASFVFESDIPTDVVCNYSAVGTIESRYRETSGNSPVTVYSHTEELLRESASAIGGSGLSVPLHIDFTRHYESMRALRSYLSSGNTSDYTVVYNFEITFTLNGEIKTLVYTPTLEMDLGGLLLNIKNTAQPVSGRVTRESVRRVILPGRFLFAAAALFVLSVSGLLFLRFRTSAMKPQAGEDGSKSPSKLRGAIEANAIDETVFNVVRLPNPDALREIADELGKPILCADYGCERRFYAIDQSVLFVYNGENRQNGRRSSQ